MFVQKGEATILLSKVLSPFLFIHSFSVGKVYISLSVFPLFILILLVILVIYVFNELLLLLVISFLKKIKVYGSSNSDLSERGLFYGKSLYCANMGS